MDQNLANNTPDATRAASMNEMPTVLIHAPQTSATLIDLVERSLNDLGYYVHRANDKDAADRLLGQASEAGITYVLLNDEDIRSAGIGHTSLASLVEGRSGILPPLPLVREPELAAVPAPAEKPVEEAVSVSPVKEAPEPYDWGEKVLFVRTGLQPGMARAITENLRDHVPYVHMANGLAEAEKLIAVASHDEPYTAIVLDDDMNMDTQGVNLGKIVKLLKENKALEKTGVILSTDRRAHHELTLPYSMLFDLHTAVIAECGRNDCFYGLTEALREVVKEEKRRHTLKPAELPDSRMEKVDRVASMPQIGILAV